MIRALLLALFLPLAALAQDIPAPLSDQVSDYAGLIDAATEARIARTLQDGRAETGVHITLVTIERMADYNATRLPDLAKRWFNTWGVGDKTRNDGVLILISRADREMRIALGAGYDVIWDGRAQRVIDTGFLPSFKNDRYAAGIEAGALAAVNLIARPFKAGEDVSADRSYLDKGKSGDWGARIATFAMFAGVLAVMLRGRIAALFLPLQRCTRCRQRGLRRHDEVIVAAGDTTAGRGTRHLVCGACGYDRETAFAIPSAADRARTGSSSGFGGGRSSGGGASGKW